MTNYCHLLYEDRINIEDGLNKSKSINQIAKDLNKSQALNLKILIYMNNINNLCRDSLNGKSPYEAMLFLCDEHILKKLNCHYIKPDDVILNDSLLKY